MKIKYALTAIVLVSSTVLLGCQSSGSDADPEPEEAAQADEGAVQIFNGTGVVMNITPSGGHLVIRHQEIEKFMGAMTMPFQIRDDSLLKSVAIGDSIDFELSYTDDGTYISAIEIAQ